eukprot:scaffold368_cov258-Pinguiococcus_pyrenoidosus.AAC.58
MLSTLWMAERARRCAHQLPAGHGNEPTSVTGDGEVGVWSLNVLSCIRFRYDDQSFGSASCFHCSLKTADFSEASEVWVLPRQKRHLTSSQGPFPLCCSPVLWVW